MSEPSWSDLGPQPAPPKDDRIADLCAEVFMAPAGKALLAELRRRYIDRSMNPMADDRALRVSATEQHFVRELEIARDRGLSAAANRKTK